MSDYVLLNGEIIPYDQARIAPFDSGFLHGIGLFETMRASNGSVPLLERHLGRLHTSCRELDLAVELDSTTIAAQIAELLEANDLTDARLRMTVSHGDMMAANEEHPDPPRTVLISAAPFSPYPETLYEKGMTVEVSSFYQNPMSPLCGHKTTSYMDRMFALRGAQKTGAGEALWFSASEKWLAEGCISNVFLVNKAGEVFTPPLRVPERPELRLVLPGIMRQRVLELAAAEGIRILEKLLRIEDVLLASEIFITNSIMGIMPVVRVERHAVGTERPGEQTRRLRAILLAH